MKKFNSALTIMLLTIVLPGVSEARFKCWTNSEGVKECGEKVPPEYAQQGHEEVNRSGITVDKQDRAKTEDELAVMKAEKAQAERQQKIDEEKAKQDRILLETFSNVDDIEMTRDGKIAAIDNNISLTERRSEKIRVDLDKRIAAAAQQEKAGKEPSAELLNDIESLERQIKNNDKFIADKRLEQDQIREDYARDIERFRELKEKQ